MKVEYSRRAAADLRKVFADCRAFGDDAAAALEKRIREIVTRLAEHPEAFAQVFAQVMERPGMHVVPLVRYPYKIFYRILEDRIRILHIRHTSRRPWTKQR